MWHALRCSCAFVYVRVQVQLLQQERSSEATAANPDQEAAIEAAIRAETDFLMQVRAYCVVKAECERALLCSNEGQLPIELAVLHVVMATCECADICSLACIHLCRSWWLPSWSLRKSRSSS
jgi:hypothetical protein